MRLGRFPGTSTVRVPGDECTRWRTDRTSDRVASAAAVGPRGGSPAALLGSAEPSRRRSRRVPARGGRRRWPRLPPFRSPTIGAPCAVSGGSIFVRRRGPRRRATDDGRPTVVLVFVPPDSIGFGSRSGNLRRSRVFRECHGNPLLVRCRYVATKHTSYQWIGSYAGGPSTPRCTMRLPLRATGLVLLPTITPSWGAVYVRSSRPHGSVLAGSERVDVERLHALNRVHARTVGRTPEPAA